MREYAKKPESQSRTLDSKPKASRQAPIDVILQRFKERNIQQYVEGEELIQGKFSDIVQREEFDEDELLQGKFDIAQREKIEEDELLQGKFNDTAQWEAIDEDELLQGKLDASPAVQKEANPTVSENRTGMPDNLKNGIEALSGYSMDDVRVHYNSTKPAQLQALAYAQGTDIHVAPGQEQHLPHEAWHVVQQKQGRVQPTMQLQGVNVNDNEGLEKEADVMGGKSINDSTYNSLNIDKTNHSKLIIQKRVDPDFITYHHNTVGRGAATKLEMKTFYHQYVQHEVKRLLELPIDDDVKEEMNAAHQLFISYLIIKAPLNEVFQKLNKLVIKTNIASDNYDGLLDSSLLNPYLTEEQIFRVERTRRKDSLPFVGNVKGMPLRGVKSKTEGEMILNNLQTALTNNLGPGYALGNVGVRGSAITGVRSRTEQPFEYGIGQFQTTDQSSDLDFFFTCPPLEARIRATQGALGNRGINASGTMNAQYLRGWLNLPGNGYPNANALLQALQTFSNNTKALTGRKSDVTFVGGATAAGLMTDKSTLIF